MKRFILSIIMLFCCVTLKSQLYPIQKPLLRGENTYFVKDQFYNFKELEFLFQHDKELSRLHRAGVRNDIFAKVFGYSTIGLWGAGVIAFVSDKSHTEGFFNSGQFFGLILIVLVSPVTGTIGLISNANEVAIKNKAIETYNKKYRDKFGRKIEYPKLGFAKSGLGIAITF